MQEIPFNLFQNGVESWQQLIDSNLGSALTHFFPITLGSDGVPNPPQGNSRFNNQLSRCIGVSFGTVTAEISGMISQSTEIRMHLALMTYPIEGEKFCVFLEVINDTGSTYYESGNDFTDLQYRLTLASAPPLVPRHGISPEFRNQLLQNLLIYPGEFRELFYSMNARNEGTSGGSSGTDVPPSNYSWVKAHYYRITGNNLAVMQNLITNGSRIDISFGVNPSDIFIQKEMFTLIVEIDNSTPATPDPITYLDFVGACPPACPD